MEDNQITVGKAVSLRVHELLIQKRMTAYRLEDTSGVLHGTMTHILKGENTSASLTTVIMLAKGFGMTLLEFLDSKHFAFGNLLNIE